jgi:flagella basal body P-ring formation protein FlgA
MKAMNRLMAISVMATVGMILSGLAIAAPVPPGGSVEIRLWSTATVTETQVKLGRIATLTGDETVTSSLKNIIVITDLPGNHKITVRAWQIAQQIGTGGYDVSRINITGAASCLVQLVSARDQKAREVSLPADQAARSAPPASLEARLREIVCQNLASQGLPKENEVKISFNPGLRELLALTNPPYEFQITPQRSPNWVGLVAFKVKVYRDSQEVQDLPILADVRVRMQVLVAAKTINSKARIGKTDIEKSWRAINSLKDKYLTDAGDVLDQQAKKMISLGTVITKDFLEPLPLVKRGQLVTVIYRKGGLDIRTVGKSLQSAFKNEVIQVRNERSKEVFRAKVVGPGQVSVEGNLVPGGSESLGMANEGTP